MACVLVCEFLQPTPSHKQDLTSAYLSDAGIAHPDDVEESGHDLWQELHAFQAERFEDEGDGLHHHGVMIGQRRVTKDTHQRHYGDRWVELV